MTLTEAADAIGCSRMTLYRWAERGLIDWELWGLRELALGMMVSGLLDAGCSDPQVKTAVVIATGLHDWSDLCLVIGFDVAVWSVDDVALGSELAGSVVRVLNLGNLESEARGLM